MTIKYLTTGEIAARLGLSPNTVSSYVKKGMLPPPDATMGQGRNLTRGWLPETIDQWNTQRPGTRRHD